MITTPDLQRHIVEHIYISVLFVKELIEDIEKKLHDKPPDTPGFFWGSYPCYTVYRIPYHWLSSNCRAIKITLDTNSYYHAVYQTIGSLKHRVKCYSIQCLLKQLIDIGVLRTCFLSDTNTTRHPFSMIFHFK